MNTHAHLLAVEIAQHCKEALDAEFDWDYSETQPGNRTVSRAHLLWMCEQIVDNADKWPASKLHRWAGFLQGYTVSCAITTIKKESEMVRAAKKHFLEEMDVDLKDHQDPESLFELELGGEN